MKYAQCFTHNHLLCLVVWNDDVGIAHQPNCGYVRLFKEHPFIGRTYNDLEVRELGRHLLTGISFSEGIRWMADKDGWWLGFYNPWHGKATIVEQVKILADHLVPRDMTPEEAIAWEQEAVAVGKNSLVEFIPS